MTDDIIIKRSWQDLELFEIEIECKTEFIVVRGKVYTTDTLIDNLCSAIEMFLSGSATTTYWQNGTRGDSTTPCMMFTLSHKDKLGHVQIEIFMEIDDGGLLSRHNCCFYVNTEIGLLQQFKERLPNLKKRELGVQVSLNNT